MINYILKAPWSNSFPTFDFYCYLVAHRLKTWLYWDINTRRFWVRTYFDSSTNTSSLNDYNRVYCSRYFTEHNRRCSRALFHSGGTRLRLTSRSYLTAVLSTRTSRYLVVRQAFALSRSVLHYALDITPHARIILSVYPANKVCPSALHAKLTHSGSRLFFPTAVYSGFSSSTLLFFSRSKIIMLLDVAAHSQYRLGEKTRAWISSPADKE